MQSQTEETLSAAVGAGLAGDGLRLPQIVERVSRDQALAAAIGNSSIRTYAHYAQLAALFDQLQVASILDVGARHGDFACMMYGYANFPGEIVSLEANAGDFAHLSRLVGDYARWRVERLEVVARAARSPGEIDIVTLFEAALARTPLARELVLRLDSPGHDVALLGRLGRRRLRQAVALVCRLDLGELSRRGRSPVLTSLMADGFVQTASLDVLGMRPGVPSLVDALFVRSDLI